MIDVISFICCIGPILTVFILFIGVIVFIAYLIIDALFIPSSPSTSSSSDDFDNTPSYPYMWLGYPEWKKEQDEENKKKK